MVGIVKATRRPDIGVAVIRTVVEPGPRPVIKILQVDRLFRNEHVLAITTSPDEAARVIRGWLVDVIGGEPR